LSDLLNKLREKINRDKEIISTEDFKEKFCKECFWKKNNNCDINIVTLDHCCHSKVESYKYKIKDN